jgi:hypothetical protein
MSLSVPEAFKQDQAVVLAQVWFWGGGNLIMNFRNLSMARWFNNRTEAGT